MVSRTCIRVLQGPFHPMRIQLQHFAMLLTICVLVCQLSSARMRWSVSDTLYQPLGRRLWPKRLFFVARDKNRMGGVSFVVDRNIRILIAYVSSYAELPSPACPKYNGVRVTYIFE